MMNDKKTLEISQNLCYNYIYDIDYAGILLDVNLLFIHVAAVVLMLSSHWMGTDYMENSLRIIFNRGSRLLCTGGFFCYVRDDIMTEEEMRAFAEEQALKVQDRISERMKTENLDPDVNHIFFGLYLCSNTTKIMDKKFIEDLKRYIDIMHEEYTSWADNLRNGVILGENPEE